MYRLLSLAALLVAVAVGVYFFCESNQSPFCSSYLTTVQSMKEEAREFSLALNSVFSDYKDHLVKTAEVGAEFFASHLNRAYSVLNDVYHEHFNNE